MLKREQTSAGRLGLSRAALRESERVPEAALIWTMSRRRSLSTSTPGGDAPSLERSRLAATPSTLRRRSAKHVDKNSLLPQP